MRVMASQDGRKGIHMIVRTSMHMWNRFQFRCAGAYVSMQRDNCWQPPPMKYGKKKKRKMKRGEDKKEMILK